MVARLFWGQEERLNSDVFGQPLWFVVRCLKVGQPRFRRGKANQCSDSRVNSRMPFRVSGREEANKHGEKTAIVHRGAASLPAIVGYHVRLDSQRSMTA